MDDQAGPSEGMGGARSRIAALVARIRELEREIEAELLRNRGDGPSTFRYRLESGKVAFEEAARQAHHELRRGVAVFLSEASLATLVSAPFMYAMVIPVVLLDLAVFVYQATCCRIYGIPRVRRSDYVVLDRRRLGYLNWIEKLNCDYCSYANGMLAYAREVAARTEQYWCPIKHAQGVLGTHDRYRAYLEYGDAEGWRRELPVLRDAVRKAE